MLFTDEFKNTALMRAISETYVDGVYFHTMGQAFKDDAASAEPLLLEQYTEELAQSLLTPSANLATAKREFKDAVEKFAEKKGQEFLAQIREANSLHEPRLYGGDNYSEQIFNRIKETVDSFRAQQRVR